MRFKNAAVIGSGSFGTALAKILGENLDTVTIIGRDAETASAINSNHRNPKYLKRFDLPKNIKACTDTGVAAEHEFLVFAVPTSATRACANDISKMGISESTVLLSCAKGIEKNSGDRMSEILREVFLKNPIAVMSGPNHAEEMAACQATCAVIGSEDDDLARDLQEAFSRPYFRPYTSHDLAGIELGGAIKNVYAIAAGISHGLGLGDNAAAAMVTRALAEMKRLGTALGGQPETFGGLSGVGDLIVTCFSAHSRNHRVGLALGEGKSLEEAIAALGMVAEGVPNTASIYEAAKKADVRTPIIDGVYSILYQGKPAAEAMKELLSRDTRSERD
ncbi:MAG: NAD(P)H-dependent glycerol-3-phosphate dehydrogenase [Akkermansiaceae bacterium]